MFKTLLSYATPKVIGAAIIVVVVGGYLLFGRGSSSSLQTLTLTPTEFKQEVSISGTVVAARHVDLGFTASGRVAHVYTKEGATVQAGALLAEIDDGDLLAAVAQKQATLDSQEAKLASLQAGTRPEEIAVAQAEVDSDMQALGQANAALLDAARTVYTKADDAVRNDVYQFINGPRTSSPSLSFYDSDTQLSNRFLGELPSVESLLNGWSASIASADASNALQLSSAMNMSSSAVTDFLADASAVLVRAIANGSVSQTQINTYASDVASGRTSLDSALTALTSAVSAQKNAAATLSTAQKNLALKKAGTVQADIDAQAALVAAAQADVESARAQLAKARIVAPFTGVITNVDAEVGKIVSPNTPEISIISSGLLQIETYIPEVSIVNVAIQQPATVTLDAYGDSVVFPATVVAIDPGETVKSGVSTYKTTLQFNAPDDRIRPGMTANVTVTTATVPNALVAPQGAVYERGNTQYVQVLVGSKTEERAVTLGKTSSLGSVVLQSGVAAGETIVLNPAK